MVKNIKNKIVGNSHNNTKVGKENMNTSKKIPTIEYSGLNTEEKVKTPRTPKDNFNKKSFHNFSMCRKTET